MCSRSKLGGTDYRSRKSSGMTWRIVEAGILRFQNSHSFGTKSVVNHHIGVTPIRSYPYFPRKIRLTANFLRSLVLFFLAAQIDRLVGWRDEELRLHSLLVGFVADRPPRRLLEGILDGFRCLGRSLVMRQRLRSHDGVARGRSAPLVRLFFGHQAVIVLAAAE